MEKQKYTIQTVVFTKSFSISLYRRREIEKGLLEKKTTNRKRNIEMNTTLKDVGSEMLHMKIINII